MAAPVTEDTHPVVFLVLTREGYDRLRALLGRVPSSLWVNLDALTRTEISELRAQGLNVTAFNYSIDSANPADVTNAVDMIRLHHMGMSVFVEYPADTWGTDEITSESSSNSQ